MSEQEERTTLFRQLQSLGLPVAYGYHSEWKDPPYLCIIGAGQEQFPADDTYYTTRNLTQIEYYFAKKDANFEESIEQLLLGQGLLYDKSEDVYLEDQDIFLIYYTV